MWLQAFVVRAKHGLLCSITCQGSTLLRDISPGPLQGQERLRGANWEFSPSMTQCTVALLGPNFLYVAHLPQ